jgi:hypothetical protein
VGHIGKSTKKPGGGHARHRKVKKSSARTELLVKTMISPQRPKNSHNRMMTGMGTPSSQSRIPRPMFASMNSSDD